MPLRSGRADRRGNFFLFRHGSGKSQVAHSATPGGSAGGRRIDHVDDAAAVRADEADHSSREWSRHRGGTGLATLCDFTLAAPSARFGYSEVRIGFIPAIVSVFLLEMIGEKKAKALLLSGRILDAGEALAMGLVTEVVPEGELMARVHELAALLLKNSPESMGAVKKMLSTFAKERLDRDLARAIRWNEKIRNSPDFREGLSAFLEKRDPVWPGRKQK